MIIAHYAHRLPANYDIGLIRARARERGTLWDATPRLFFKAFLLREAGRYGAIANAYSSLYLWSGASAFADFLTDGRYRVVTESFGRAEIESRFVLDARKGTGGRAHFALVEETAIPLDAELTGIFAAEVERNKRSADRRGTVAAVVGVDPRNWRLTRILLSEEEPAEGLPGEGYEILHLARPLLETLPGPTSEASRTG